MLKISNNEELNNEIFNSFMENDTIKMKINEKLNKVDILLLYKLSKENYNESMYINKGVLGFEYEDAFISNPFVDEVAFEIVNPIVYYGNDFLESDFINLLKNIVELRK